MAAKTMDSLGGFRKETDSLGEVYLLADKRWGADAAAAGHFSVGKDLMLREMIRAYAILKKSLGACKLCRQESRRAATHAHCRSL